MIPDNVRQRVINLRKLIDEYRYHYHVLDESIISESAADSLKHELSQLETQYPELISPDSPTQRIAGQALDKFSKVEHSQRMTSLADVFSEAELRDWLLRISKLGVKNPELFADIKMDGLACALIYENGFFSQALTRGDGLIGEDVTHNVRTIQNIPLSINNKNRIELRGEIVIFKKDFDNLNQKQQQSNKPTFANPRNLAAGTIRQLDPKIAAARPLRFIAYDLIDETTKTNTLIYQKLKALGFQSSGQEQHFSDLDSLSSFIARLDKSRHDLPFNTDGVVVKINDRAAYRALGIVGKTPRAAIAFKYPAEEATTRVLDIILSIGRTGVATPIAILDPVVVAGSTVQAASLHNSDEIQRLDLRIGDTVIIHKAGDIIPKISRVLKDLRPAESVIFDYETALKEQYPDLEFIRPVGEAAYRLKGNNQQTLKRALEYYASKPNLNIEGLGTKNVEALIDSGLVSSIPDIYSIIKSQLLQLERFAERSAQKLIDSIQTSKNPSLARFIASLGIRHVGAQTAVDLSHKFRTFTNFSQASLEQLLALNGVGRIAAESILAWFANDENLAMLKRFQELGVKPQANRATLGALSGLAFVITGTLSTMSRDQAEQDLRALGADFQKSITRSSNYLVIGANAGKSKIEKAKKLGVKVLDEPSFLELLGTQKTII